MSIFGEIPIVGNLLDGILFGPDTSKLTGALDDAAAFYEGHAPEAYKARQQVLQQASTLFGPVNNALTQMYGPQAALPPDQQAAAFADPAPQFAQPPGQGKGGGFWVPPGSGGTSGWGY